MPCSYGINADLNNNLYMLDFNSGDLGMLDGKTKKLDISRTEIPNSRPRRGRVDGENRLWFAEFYGDRAGVYDYTKNEVKEYKVPTEWTAPYDALLDRTGMLWTAGMETDRILTELALYNPHPSRVGAGEFGPSARSWRSLREVRVELG